LAPSSPLRAAFTGKNPSTGAALNIPASAVHKFLLGAKFKVLLDPKAVRRKADKAGK
jgi:DNA-binding protein HU-beta